MSTPLHGRQSSQLWCLAKPSRAACETGFPLDPSPKSSWPKPISEIPDGQNSRQRGPAFQESTDRSRTTLGKNQPVSCQITRRHQCLTTWLKKPSRRTAYFSRQHKRRGGKNSDEGDRLYSGCQTADWHRSMPLPAEYPSPDRRIPASCPFPRSGCHHSRVATNPLVISVFVRKHHVTLSSSPIQRGRERRPT